MSLLQAIVLAIVQGATEFLPVSSSGHLVLVPAYLGWELNPEHYKHFIVIAHIGTLLAVVVYYRRELWAILQAIFQGTTADTGSKALGATSGRHLFWLIALATVPAVVFGLLLNDFFDQLLRPLPVAVSLLVTAALLYGADRTQGHREPGQMTLRDGFLIGLGQALAIIPGISRSGATITAGQWRGLNQPWAAKFAFLMSIPPIAGAFALDFGGLVGTTDWLDHVPAYIVGLTVSAVVGYLAIYLVIRSVEQGRLFVRFGTYCLAVGVVSIAANLAGWI